MLKELKAPQNDSNAWCSQSDRLQMAEDTLSAVRRVRREVVDSMRMLMKAAKDKRSEGMFAIIEEMLRKTKCLCNLLDPNLVEETLTFLEDNRYEYVLSAFLKDMYVLSCLIRYVLKDVLPV